MPNQQPIPAKPPVLGHNGRPTTGPGWRGQPGQQQRDAKLNQSPTAIYRKQGGR